MTCSHENADHLEPGEWFSLKHSGLERRVIAEQFRCVDCGAWLSLGPAKAAPRIEHRFAQAVAELCDLWEPGADRDHEIDQLAGFYAGVA